jgi:hypothetical protein
MKNLIEATDVSPEELRMAFLMEGRSGRLEEEKGEEIKGTVHNILSNIQVSYTFFSFHVCHAVGRVPDETQRRPTITPNNKL